MQSTLKHALPWHNNATRPARSPASAAAEIHTRAARRRRAIRADVAGSISDAVGGLGRLRVGRAQRPRRHGRIGRGGANGRVGGADRESVHVGRVYGCADVVVVVVECCVFSEGCRAVAATAREFFWNRVDVI